VGDITGNEAKVARIKVLEVCMLCVLMDLPDMTISLG